MADNDVDYWTPYVDSYPGGAQWYIAYHNGGPAKKKAITGAQANAIIRAASESAHESAVIAAVGTLWLNANVPSNEQATWLSCGWDGVQKVQSDLGL